VFHSVSLPTEGEEMRLTPVYESDSEIHHSAAVGARRRPRVGAFEPVLGVVGREGYLASVASFIPAEILSRSRTLTRQCGYG